MRKIPSRHKSGRWCFALPALFLGIISGAFGADGDHSVPERLHLLLGLSFNDVVQSYPDIRRVPPSVRDIDSNSHVTEYFRLPPRFAREQGFSRIDIKVHGAVLVAVEAVKSVATWHDYAKAQKDFLSSPAQIKQIGDPRKGSVLMVSDKMNADGVPVFTKIMMSATIEPWELIVAFGYTDFTEYQAGDIPQDPALLTRP